jgi:hypothetical protein
MKRYNVFGSNATGTSSKTLLAVIGSTTIRPIVYDLTVGDSTAAQDFSMQLALRASTTAGTAGNAVTPFPLDAGDVPAVCTAGNAYSGEPTYASGAISLQFSMNSRATYRWVASPYGEIVGKLAANNGIGLQLISASTTVIMDGSLMYWE